MTNRETRPRPGQKGKLATEEGRDNDEHYKSKRFLLDSLKSFRAATVTEIESGAGPGQARPGQDGSSSYEMLQSCKPC